MRARSLATLTLLLAAVAFTGCDSNNEENEATLQGTVVNDVTSQPIAGAFVQVDGTPLTTQTDSAGMYSLVYEFESETNQSQGERSISLTIEAFADDFLESATTVQAFAGSDRNVPQIRLTPAAGGGNDTTGVGPATLAGTVTDDESGAPLSGVRVVVQGVGVNAETGDDGSFTLTVPSVRQSESYVVRFTKPGFGPVEEGVTLFANERTDIVASLGALIVVGPATVRGVITDAVSDEPIAGLTVQVLGTEASPATTDDEGRFAITLPSVQGSEEYTLRITGEGYTSIEEPVLFVAAETVEFAATTARVGPATLEGFVFDADGDAALAGVRVVVQGAGVNTDTGADGSFSLAVPNVRGSQDYTIRFTKQGFVPAEQQVTLFANERTDISATLSSLVSVGDATLTGTITDSVSEEPIPGLTVSLVGLGQSATTGKNGRYSLTVEAVQGSREVVVRVTGAGYETVEETVTLLANQTTAFSATVARVGPATLEGFVFDAEGDAALAGVRVVVQGAGVSTDTGADGSFSLAVPNVRGSQDYTIRFTKQGFVPAEQQVTLFANERTDISAALSSLVSVGNATLTGTITDGVSDEPVSGLTVSLIGLKQSVTATTGANGRYTLVLPSVQGSRDIVVRISGDGYETVEETVTLVANQTTEFSASIVEVGPATLEGFVFDTETNNPVQGVRVVVQGTGVEATTGGDGSFSLAVPSVRGSQSYTVRFTKQGFAPAQQEVTLFANERTDISQTLASIVNVGPATLTGTITDGVSDEPVSGLTVSAGGQTTTTSGTGRYTLVVPAVQGSQDVTVTVSGAGYETVEETVTLVANQTTEFSASIVEVGPATLEGFVFDTETNNPVQGVRVVVQGTGVEATTGGDGSFSLAVPNVRGSQSYTVRFTKQGFTPAQQDVTLFANERTDISQTLTAIVRTGPATVSGTLIDPVSGQPLSGLTVEVLGQGVSTITGSNGRYTLTLPSIQGEADFTVQISGTGIETITEVVTFVADGEVNFSPVLVRVGTATLTGTVTSATSGNDVSGVTVRIASEGAETTTGMDGRFTLAVPNVRGTETFTVTFSKAGFFDTQQTVTLTPGETEDVVVMITRDPNAVGEGEARSITLVERTPEDLTVAGAGGTDEVASLTFVVYDAQGRPVNNANAVEVRFSIAQPQAGSAPEAATLNVTSATTNEDGEVRVFVTSGTLAQTIQIRAEFTQPTSGAITASEPVTIAISGGLPAQTSFSVAAAAPNFAGAASVAGLTQTVTAYVGDRYGNPVVPGTQVYFTTTAGIIEGSATTGALGTATVTLLSTAISPTGVAPRDGFATVTAGTSGVGGQPVSASIPVLFSGAAQIEVLTAEREGNAYRVRFRVSDFNDNPLGPGTTISVSAEGDNVTVVGDEFGYDGFVLDNGPGRTVFETLIVAEDPGAGCLSGERHPRRKQPERESDADHWRGRTDLRRAVRRHDACLAARCPVWMAGRAASGRVLF